MSDIVKRLREIACHMVECRAAFAPDALFSAADEILRLRAELDEARRVPDGWKLVPVELTLEMRVAFAEANDAYDGFGGYETDIWRAMLAAAPQPAIEGPETWKSIETAPKDGTAVLLYEYQYKNIWQGISPTEVVLGFWDDDNEKWFNPEEKEYFEPTHWMKLPEPPKL